MFCSAPWREVLCVVVRVVSSSCKWMAAFSARCHFHFNFQNPIAPAAQQANPETTKGQYIEPICFRKVNILTEKTAFFLARRVRFSAKSTQACNKLSTFDLSRRVSLGRRSHTSPLYTCSFWNLTLRHSIPYPPAHIPVPPREAGIQHPQRTRP